MIHSIGEILLDCFQKEEGKDSLSLECHLGGAPFNVAANVISFGGEASFYGAIGEDPFGSFALSEASRYGVKLHLAKRKVNTTLALVTLKDGERSFSFLRDPGADYLLDIEEFLSTASLHERDIVHVGSLLLSKKEGCIFLGELLKALKGKGFRLSFDINLRVDLYESKESALKIYREYLKSFDIVKVSSDELAYFGYEEAEGFLKEELQEGVSLFVTYGEKGSAYLEKGRRVEALSKKLHPIDTTGAGDAFYARALYELSKGKGLLSDAEIGEILQKANESGADALMHKGALPSLS